MRTRSVLAAFVSTLSFAAVAAAPAAASDGVPGFRGSDHIGVTVPDLDQAVKFFVEVMGCEAFFKMGPFKADDDWMAVHLGVHPRAEIPQMQLVRCGYGTNLELLQYRTPDQNTAIPKNSDLGGYHVAFYVDDMDKAVGLSQGQGAEVSGRAHGDDCGAECRRNLGLLPVTLGHEPRAGQLPQGQGIREAIQDQAVECEGPGQVRPGFAVRRGCA